LRELLGLTQVDVGLDQAAHQAECPGAAPDVGDRHLTGLGNGKERDSLHAARGIAVGVHARCADATAEQEAGHDGNDDASGPETGIHGYSNP